MKKKQLDPFTQLVRTVGPCASMDDTRVNINRIRVRDGLAHATDGHRLVVTETTVSSGDYIRAGKGLFVPGEASPVFPDFREVRPKSTVEAYQLPIAALRTDADGVILGFDHGQLCWNRPGDRGLPDFKHPGFVTNFDLGMKPPIGDKWPSVGLNLRYVREVAIALGWDVDNGSGTIPIRLDPSDFADPQRTRVVGAFVEYRAPVEIRPPDSASDACYGLVMPIRL